MNQGLTSEDKWKTIERSLEKIPSLSPVVGKVVTIANDINASPRDLMKVISLDPVLTAKVLKLVNSAYFGMSHHITSLNRALIQLGVNTVKNLALSTAILGVMEIKEKNPPISSDDFWHHSIGVAAASKLLAKHLGVDEKRQEEYFICGLLHDIGKIPLIRFFPEDIRASMDLASAQQCNLYVAEDMHYTNNHCAIGLALGQRWKLNEELLFVIGNHHDPLRASDHKQINQCVYVANNYCKLHRIGNGGNTFVEEQLNFVLKMLNIDPLAVDQVLSELENEINKARIFLNIAKQEAA